ncbi:ArsR/SmtB family transcription factor [Streptomyces sp. UG1]|uniref:ArsR/SmtB family transcription factor n=1 Tax=Streptomyces sp. UG1 TaxID=3417652 RepID=UPI003CED936C
MHAEEGAAHETDLHPTAGADAARAECSDTDTVARFFRALSDPAQLLRSSVEHAGSSQPRVSVHLSCLVDCGYVTARRDGRKLRYNAAALDCCPRIPG